MTTKQLLIAGAARLGFSASAGGRVTFLDLCSSDRDGLARSVLRPFPDEVGPAQLQHWPKGGIYPLVPYSNRIKDGVLLFQGKRYELTPHPDARPHTLHGHAHRMAWETISLTHSHVTMQYAYAGGAEWPWPFRATLDIDLEPTRAVFSLGLTNEGQTPMPGGIGLHPYFQHDPDDHIAFDAPIDWPVTADYLAALQRDRSASAKPGPLPLGEVTLYRSGWRGLCVIDRTNGDRIEMQADPVFSHFVLHRPADAAHLCAEPVSHVADGFNLFADGHPVTGTVVLEPGKTLNGSVTISLCAAGPRGNQASTAAV
ncbi:aldose 1-epimerase [Bradyrhizobium mercantei]|uniref:aldose 1-epimerase n=1 Tax=Bradyrhizobium mercantei TaxID=1904807 RepID=UPI00097658A2|nr:aldose 1-epimerase [Bradyrhizobium mercantei]